MVRRRLTPRPRRWLAALMVVLASTGMLVACGTSKYTYVANRDEHAYLRIPSDWHQIDQSVIDDYFAPENPDSAVGQIRKQLRWSAAYDAGADPMPQHMTTGVLSKAPVLYVTIRHLAPSEQDMVSYDYLRDIFTYVTEAGRRKVAAAGYDVSSFELLYDEILPTTKDGLHGVRVVFNYELATGVHTFDQTAYANGDSSVLYLLLIRCSAQCYRERAVEIDDVATSFTVRSTA